MRRLVAIIVVVLAVLIDGFFALVNFYPVAPTRGRGPRREVLVAMDPSQARWLRENLIEEFNAEHNVNLALVAVDEEQVLPTVAHAGGDLILAAVPRARGARVMRDHLIRPFDEVIPTAQMTADLADLVPRALHTAQLDERQVFLPRLSLVDIAVYRLGKVRDAVRHWSLLRPQIDAALKAINGRGLPPDYTLELEPEQWDAFDRFVIGYYWAHRRYDGKKAQGRIAHRTGEALDGVVDITEGIYRAGATDATLAKIDDTPARDYFTWETLYRENGIYAPLMFGARPVDDDGIIDGLRSGELFLATVDQMQAFTLHGGSHLGSPPGVDDPDDLGFAPLQRISSVELGTDGKPLRPGQVFSFREDWVWALPAKSADPQLAYELVKFLWTRENHYRECEALGTLPMRADVVRERSSLFRLVWMDDVLDAAFAEWERAHHVPELVEGELGSVYTQLWHRIVYEKKGPLSAQLAAPPAPRPPPAVVTVDVDNSEPPDAGAPPREEDDDDSPGAIDRELWRGKVELE